MSTPRSSAAALGSARRGGGAAEAGESGAAAAGSAGVIRIPWSWRSARASRPMPASARSSSGTRSQPPRPTTIAVAPPADASSLRRPSRMCSVRSATVVAAGSWLTSTTVAPSSWASSAISR